jgi:hypothetical protein
MKGVWLFSTSPNSYLLTPKPKKKLIQPLDFFEGNPAVWMGQYLMPFFLTEMGAKHRQTAFINAGGGQIT